MSVYRIISAERASFPVSVICRLLGVSRSGYHEWATRAPSDRALGDAWLTERIREIHEANLKVYGSPRIHAELRMQYAIEVSRKRVERLMREAGISGLAPRKRGRTTIRVPGVRVADDLVERDFRPQAPNVLWVADVTYLKSWEGWVYLAAVQDAYSRRIVGSQLAEHMEASLVVDALQMAISQRRPEPGLIHHSDQGSQYVSLAFGQAARGAGIARATPVGARFDPQLALPSEPKQVMELLLSACARTTSPPSSRRWTANAARRSSTSDTNISLT